MKSAMHVDQPMLFHCIFGFTQKIELCMRQQFRVPLNRARSKHLTGIERRSPCEWLVCVDLSVKREDRQKYNVHKTSSSIQYVAKVKNSKRQEQPGKQCRQETTKIQKVTEYQTSHTQEVNGEQNTRGLEHKPHNLA